MRRFSLGDLRASNLVHPGWLFNPFDGPVNLHAAIVSRGANESCYHTRATWPAGKDPLILISEFQLPNVEARAIVAVKQVGARLCVDRGSERLRLAFCNFGMESSLIRRFYRLCLEGSPTNTSAELAGTQNRRQKELAAKANQTADRKPDEAPVPGPLWHEDCYWRILALLLYL